MMNVTCTDCRTDCRTDIGRAVGLIDSIIFIARALAREDLNNKEVHEALKDLQQDEDVINLLTPSAGCDK